MRDKIGRVLDKLPKDVVAPRIKKADADAFPFMHLALYSDRHDVRDLADYAYRYLESRLEAVPGVSSVEIFGGGEYEMKLILDPVKLTGYNLTSEDVVKAIRDQNVEKPAGNIITQDREIVVTTKARLMTEADFDRLVIGEKEGYLIRLSDVGRADLNAIDRRNRVLFNGKNAVAIGVTKQSVANALTIARDIKKIMPDIKLPTGMHLEIARDRTLFVERSIDEVYETIAIATILVILVIFAFLRSMRAVLIPLVTIPLSLIGAFALMYACGFTINILTLLALVLAIGLVVDDAIVMLENVHRYIEMGDKPLTAAFKGAKEISFAVIAMTITLAAVYAPI
ncbi:MAG: efflux RND transporter permease subunit, partial [bacterium]